MRATLFATVLALTAAAFFSAPANAQAINCNYYQSLTTAEIEVCRNPGLQQLEQRLTRNYFRIRSELRGPAAYQFEQEQAGWREARRQCVRDQRCLYGIYQRRIDELRAYRGR